LHSFSDICCFVLAVIGGGGDVLDAFSVIPAGHVQVWRKNAVLSIPMGSAWMKSHPDLLQAVSEGKNPGAWLMQIKDAGHALLVQYPDEVNRVLQIFLSTTTNPG
jgi:hypothetical protein